MIGSTLFLKPNLVALFPSKLLFPHTFHKPLLSLRTTFFFIPHFSTNSLSYGPSLSKGCNPSQFPQHVNDDVKQQSQDQNEAVLREEIFTRVFDLAGLRVPSGECSALESRLRGHLLNWPRVRNIARVPGDDVDPDIAPLLGHGGDGDGESGLIALQRRIHGKAEGDGDVLSPVLYREKLAKTFNSRGYVKFRNLAKISRPNRNPKKKEKEKAVEVEEDKPVRKGRVVAVEVVEEEEEEGLRNLLGEEFGRSKWRGSTRLLLLDERYAGRGVEELPEALKVTHSLIFREFSVAFKFALPFYVYCFVVLSHSVSTSHLHIIFTLLLALVLMKRRGRKK